MSSFLGDRALIISAHWQCTTPTSSLWSTLELPLGCNVRVERHETTGEKAGWSLVVADRNGGLMGWCITCCLLVIREQECGIVTGWYAWQSPFIVVRLNTACFGSASSARLNISDASARTHPSRPADSPSSARSSNRARNISAHWNCSQSDQTLGYIQLTLGTDVTVIHVGRRGEEVGWSYVETAEGIRGWCVSCCLLSCDAGSRYHYIHSSLPSIEAADQTQTMGQICNGHVSSCRSTMDAQQTVPPRPCGLVPPTNGIRMMGKQQAHAMDMERTVVSTAELADILDPTKSQEGVFVTMFDLELVCEAKRGGVSDYLAVMVVVKKLIVDDKTLAIGALHAHITLGRWRCTTNEKWTKMRKKLEPKVAGAKLKMQVRIERDHNRQLHLRFYVHSSGINDIHAWCQCVHSSGVSHCECYLPPNQEHRLASSKDSRAPTWHVSFS